MQKQDEEINKRSWQTEDMEKKEVRETIRRKTQKLSECLTDITRWKKMRTKKNESPYINRQFNE